MIPAIKAELRKVFTIRSTYIILGFLTILVIFFSFYVGGIHTDKANLLEHNFLYMDDQQAINFVSVFVALIGLMLFTHEFRFNTIAYALTSSNSRNKVLLAKVIVVSCLAVTAALVVGVASPLLANLGIHANHLKLVHQVFPYKSMLWRGLVFAWGYAMAGLVFAALIRNQIGAIVTLFIVPDTVEGLLSILLKKNTVYLPFSALHSMLGAGINSTEGNITHFHAMLVFLAYLLVGWAVAWYLFLKRDAG